ncbi:nucleic acid dioxygenase ALKBH1-like [Asterias amurensis]|uniref:nucleic acid dioxygenase ALKBH1-like n=1 Tax=Asterias amurensis TaxID=7602 RepID=UPI003AB38A8A
MAAPVEQEFVNTEQVNNAEANTSDKFREQFKRYKRKKPPPDLCDVVDFAKSDLVAPFQPEVTCHSCKDRLCQRLGLKPVNEWRCFSLRNAPGFVYIENPFRPGYQRYWIKRCLQDYPNKPNVCNLDSHTNPGNRDALWDQSTTNSSSTNSKKCLIDQLRWVTLGYHYDWTSKLYHHDNHTVFPEDLSALSSIIADVMGYPSFDTQAAIVNYYHLDSTLGGHTDHSEFDLTAPIISYSLGQSAVFLLGGKSKETTPLAMYLHSGDIIVMGGESRLCYHAVPRVLPPDGSSKLPAYLNKVNHMDLDRLESSTSTKEPCCCNKTQNYDCGETQHLNKGNEMNDSLEYQSDSAARLDKPSIREHTRLKASVDSYQHELTCYPTERTSDADTSSQVDNYNKGCVSLGTCPTSSEPTCTKSVMSEGKVNNSSSCCSTEVIHREDPTGIMPQTTSPEQGRTQEPGANDSQCGLVSTNIPNSAVVLETVKTLQGDIWEPFGEFMSRSRINISVRQVTGPGCDFPADTLATVEETLKSSTSDCIQCDIKEGSQFSGVKRKADSFDQSQT